MTTKRKEEKKDSDKKEKGFGSLLVNDLRRWGATKIIAWNFLKALMVLTSHWIEKMMT